MLALSVGWHDKNKNFTFNTLLIKVSSTIAKGETNSWNTIMSEIHLKNDMLHVLNFKPKQEGFKTFSQKKKHFILLAIIVCYLLEGKQTIFYLRTLSCSVSFTWLPNLCFLITTNILYCLTQPQKSVLSLFTGLYLLFKL